MCYPEKGVSYLESGVPKTFTSPHIKLGSKVVYECHYVHAPECQYFAENVWYTSHSHSLCPYGNLYRVLILS